SDALRALGTLIGLFVDVVPRKVLFLVLGLKYAFDNVKDISKACPFAVTSDDNTVCPFETDFLDAAVNVETESSDHVWIDVTIPQIREVVFYVEKFILRDGVINLCAFACCQLCLVCDLSSPRVKYALLFLAVECVEVTGTDRIGIGGASPRFVVNLEPLRHLGWSLCALCTQAHVRKNHKKHASNQHGSF